MDGKRFLLEVQPNIPDSLSRLNELAADLYYSWDRQVRALFFRLDSNLWNSTGHNPKLFLRRIKQENLEKAARDPVYIQDYHRVLSAYESYLQNKNQAEVSKYLDLDTDLVAYFCAEYGLHESFPIYSGGLGILAGDHCKAASDMAIPFIAVGLLYRQGYFTQMIDPQGNQIAQSIEIRFNELPIVPVRKSDGDYLMIDLELPGRILKLKAWKAKVGHITLYLLDSDIPSNNPDDRRITHQLYGGDITNRLLQEIVLGVGGVGILNAMGIKPTVWHINEGHAAFQLLERCRQLVATGMDPYASLESIAANTVFTTHTPVPAGHDIFDRSLVAHYLGAYIAQLKLPIDEFLALGQSPINTNGFNMTAFALRLSRFHNGVSRIHGSVASTMEGYIWPEIPPAQNPMGYVTNGVHVPTFLASEWINYFDLLYGGGWRSELLNNEFWLKIYDIADHSFWSIRQSLKSKMFEAVIERLSKQFQRNGCSETQLRRVTRHLSPQKTDVLTIGFARRFATYKRATLIFHDLERLKRLLNNPDRPIVLIFAGKAHPLDQPGQSLIRKIHELSNTRDFVGKIILVENYDLSIARKLIAGVDVWLNNPEYPLEASGTSGEKAALNGVINLSILDGWWGEGYNGQNGWAISPHEGQYTTEYKNLEEANELLDILEYEVIPCYFDRNSRGYSSKWIERSKASMSSILPRFNAQRMLRDYLYGYYSPAALKGKLFSANNFAIAHDVSAWKKKVQSEWPHATLARRDQERVTIYEGDYIIIKVEVNLGNLNPADVRVECVHLETDCQNTINETTELFSYEKMLPEGGAIYSLAMKPHHAGRTEYAIRMYPYHPDLIHPFETGYMRWVQ